MPAPAPFLSYCSCGPLVRRQPTAFSPRTSVPQPRRRVPFKAFASQSRTDSADPLHGDQEGQFFHGYYKSHCYLPLYVYCGGDVLCARLRPPNIDAAAGSAGELEQIDRRIRQLVVGRLNWGLLLQHRQHGEPDQGMPAGAVRRPHQQRHGPGQRAAAALRLLRLRAGARIAAPGAGRRPLGQGPVRHDTGSLAEGRRARADHRAQGLSVVLFRLPAAGRVCRRGPGPAGRTGPRPARVARRAIANEPAGCRRGAATPRQSRRPAKGAVSAAPTAKIAHPAPP